MTKRFVDFALSLTALILLALPLFITYLAIKLTSNGPALYWSKRVGKGNKIFLMPKFRSMLLNTPQLATHLLTQPDQYLTPIGAFLRKTSIDELPQLISVLIGDMSLVGPRPALFNQDDLIALRTKKDIHQLKPGITGWAQINGRDELPIPTKVDFDHYYLLNQSLYLDIKILFLTVLKVVRKEGITH